MTEATMDILLGVFLVILGISVAFVGIQLFFFMLPIIGLVTGFYVGAELVAALFGDGFLATATGWIVGIVVGLLFAFVARLWWYAGVLISSGVVGSVLLTGIAHTLGVESGVALFVVALIGAILFIFVTLTLNLPVYMVIWNTALSGAVIAVSGAMLVFNRIERSDLEYGTAVAAIEESWVWVLVMIAVAAVGIVRQLGLKEQVRLPSHRWAPAQGSV
jgi:hypothetical protein